MKVTTYNFKKYYTVCSKIGLSVADRLNILKVFHNSASDNCKLVSRAEADILAEKADILSEKADMFLWVEVMLFAVKAL